MGGIATLGLEGQGREIAGYSGGLVRDLGLGFYIFVEGLCKLPSFQLRD